MLNKFEQIRIVTDLKKKAVECYFSKNILYFTNSYDIDLIEEYQEMNDLCFPYRYVEDDEFVY